MKLTDIIVIVLSIIAMPVLLIIDLVSLIVFGSIFFLDKKMKR